MLFVLNDGCSVISAITSREVRTKPITLKLLKIIHATDNIMKLPGLVPYTHINIQIGWRFWFLDGNSLCQKGQSNIWVQSLPTWNETLPYNIRFTEKCRANKKNILIAKGLINIYRNINKFQNFFFHKFLSDMNIQKYNNLVDLNVNLWSLTKSEEL